MKNGERLSREHLPDRSEACLRVGITSGNPPDRRQSRMMSQRGGGSSSARVSRPSRSGVFSESRSWQRITRKLQNVQSSGA